MMSNRKAPARTMLASNLYTIDFAERGRIVAETYAHRTEFFGSAVLRGIRSLVAMLSSPSKRSGYCSASPRA